MQWMILISLIVSFISISCLDLQFIFDTDYGPARLMHTVELLQYRNDIPNFNSFAIAYTITPKYFHNIMVSIYSIAKVKKSEIKLNIYIFILGEIKQNYTCGNEFKMVKRLSPLLKIKLVRLNPDVMESKFNLKIIAIKPIVMSRLLLYQMLKEEIVLYLDSEVIAGNDFYPLILNYLKTFHVIYGVEDIGIQKYNFLRKRLAEQHLDARFYINAGIFFFKNGPKAERLFSEAIHFANSRKIIYSDQDSINHLGSDNIGLLPYVFNCRTGLIQEREDCIFHHDTVTPTNLLWKSVENEFLEELKRF